MLRHLSEMEQKALIVLATEGPGGKLDAISMSKLFALGLVEVDDHRRVMMTESGRHVYRQISGKKTPPDGQG